MKLSFLFLLLLTLAGCSSTPYYDLPFELRNNDAKINFLINYSPYLANKIFFLDPGHGGDDRNNVGYKGKAVEADANLAVALELGNFLKSAGAKVIYSRIKDTTVNLKDRSILANKSGADFFISIHHNAPAEKDDIWTNYSHVYYHADIKDYEYNPNNRDLARYIERDLSYAMRNSGGPASFDGTSSDYTIYPKQGFSVLRLSEIPAVLVECGFTTSHFESGRIVLPEFNKIEAWGIFKGIARYLKNEIPVISFDSLQFTAKNDSTLNFVIKSTYSIDEKSIKIFIDSVEQSNRILKIEQTFTTLHKDNNWENAILEISIAGLPEGQHEIKVIAANSNGIFALPFRKKFNISENIKK